MAFCVKGADNCKLYYTKLQSVVHKSTKIIQLHTKLY